MQLRARAFFLYFFNQWKALATLVVFIRIYISLLRVELCRIHGGQLVEKHEPVTSAFNRSRSVDDRVCLNLQRAVYHMRARSTLLSCRRNLFTPTSFVQTTHRLSYVRPQARRFPCEFLLPLSWPGRRIVGDRVTSQP